MVEKTKSKQAEKTPIPEDIIRGIISLSRASKIPPKIVFEDFKEIMEDYVEVQAMKADPSHKICLSKKYLGCSLFSKWFWNRKSEPMEE